MVALRLLSLILVVHSKNWEVQMTSYLLTITIGRLQITWLKPVLVTTGPPNGPVLFYWLVSVVFCRLLSSVVVCNAAGVRARGRSGGRHCTAGQYGYVPLGWHLLLFYSPLFIARRRRTSAGEGRSGAPSQIIVVLYCIVLYCIDNVKSHIHWNI